jgi:tetratricopeptide (TPR) repeat protein
MSEQKVSDTTTNGSAADAAVRKEIQSAVQASLKKLVREAIAELKGEVKESITAAAEAVQPAAEPQPETPADEKFDNGAPGSRPHAFVVMPFGTKKASDGKIYNFNAIYQTMIKPALESAGFEAFRADEETTSGDILTDMFQELLLADLVLADMSIDNANVFYELGVRHAFRKRGIVHIQSGRAYMPFDVFNVRTISYGTIEDGTPDPATLEKDIQAIARVARDTWASDQDSIHSPIFNLLTGLNEPHRADLRTPLATGFWREHGEWKQRVTVARRQKRIGDILLLTEEISNPLIKEEAIGEAGAALRGMGRHELALQQYRQGLELSPKNLEFRRQEAFHLNRIGRVDEAIVKLENFLETAPADSEAIGILGRIYKDMWQESWRSFTDEAQRLEEAFQAYHWLIKAFDTYLKGYRFNLNDTYPGTNAHTLAVILEHLAARFEDRDDPDPDILRVLRLLPELRSMLVFALEEKAMDEKTDYWTLVSLAELRLFTAEKPVQVTRAYRKSLIAARKNTFFLQSSLSQLDMLQSLGLRPEFIEAGIQAINDEIDRIQKDNAADGAETEARPPFTEEQAILFSGHALDEPERKASRRFPPEMEAEVREQIGAALDKLKADGNDAAFTAGAAAGSTIIFIEECLAREMRVDIHLPYREPDYLKNFVAPGGDAWTERYYNVRNHPNVSIRLQSDHVGKPKEGINPYERNNRWALYSSLLLGIDKVRLIALWDGVTSSRQDLDGKLVHNMVEQMRRVGGMVEHINTTKFRFWMKGREIARKAGETATVLVPHKPKLPPRRKPAPPQKPAAK